MIRQSIIEDLGKIIKKEQIRLNEPMSAHTTFRVGGPAELFVQPKTEELKEVTAFFRAHGIPYTIIGNGSNLLVCDRGIKGAVIELGKAASEVSVEGTFVRANAGAMLSKTANMAADAGLTGMEFASGIPGTLGGAVVMNAGAYGGEMSQIIKEVTVLTPDGEIKTLSAAELELGYRSSCIAKNEYIVMSAVLALERGDRDKIAARMEELKARRIEKQPLEYPSAGSTFKRPEGYFAGKLIMDAGLRGCSVGGAQVSEKHCGFVINKGGATASDIKTLMDHIIRVVEEKFKVTLEAEVRKLGEFE